MAIVCFCLHVTQVGIYTPHVCGSSWNDGSTTIPGQVLQRRSKPLDPNVPLLPGTQNWNRATPTAAHRHGKATQEAAAHQLPQLRARVPLHALFVGGKLPGGGHRGFLRLGQGGDRRWRQQMGGLAASSSALPHVVSCQFIPLMRLLWICRAHVCTACMAV